jgi:hypothetical protein
MPGPSRIRRLFSFPLDDSLRQALEAIRADTGAPVAEQIRRGIKLWLEANGRPVAGAGKQTAVRRITKRR